MAFAAVALYPSIKPNVVQAQTAPAPATTDLYNKCQSGSYAGTLGEWDWPKFFQLNYGGENLNSGTTNFPDFDKGNSSYFIYRTPAQQNAYDTAVANGAPTLDYPAYPQAGWNQYTALVSTDNSSRLKLSQQNNSTIQILNNNPPSYYSYILQDGIHHDTRNVTGGSTFNYERNVSLPNVGCVLVAHNVDYADSWTYNKIQTDIPSGDDIKCATLDVACAISKLFRGVANTFKAVGQAIVGALASLFMPDPEVIKNKFQDFQSFMSNKLGFLVYPFSFLGNFFGAFGDTSNTWCSATSCTKNVGNFFGQPFTLKVDQMKYTMPTVWTWLLNLIRGLTILTLVLAIRMKYRGVIDK
jgi:hypothetical protein